MISKYLAVFYPLGLDWDSISECAEWMVPFVSVAKKVPAKLKNFKKVAAEDRHNIQTHTNYLDMLVGGLWQLGVHHTPLLLLRQGRVAKHLPAHTWPGSPQPAWSAVPNLLFLAPA